MAKFADKLKALEEKKKQPKEQPADPMADHHIPDKFPKPVVIYNWLTQQHYNFKYNEIRAQLEGWHNGKKIPNIDEPLIDYLVIQLQLSQTLKSCSANAVRQVMNGLFGHQNRYNPIEDYFASLPTHRSDMPDYITKLAACVTVSSNNKVKWFDYFKKWLVGAVAQALQQGKNELMLIFMSPEEGVGKTRFLNYLCPEPLLEYRHSGQILLNGGKDLNAMLAECFLINIDDQLDSSNWKDLSGIKTFVTQEDINQREAYAKERTRRPRIASFCATVNSRQFLTEEKNRRYLVFQTDKINHKAVAEIPIDKVWAQALHLLKKGFDYRFGAADIQELNSYNQDFRRVPIEEELLGTYYKRVDDWSCKGITRSEIMVFLQNKTNMKLSPPQISKALQALGYTKKRGRREGSDPLDLFNAECLENSIY
jgi:predicted P-loop ATPase